MSATHADTCINALKNIRDLPSGNTSEINMGGTQGTYLVVIRSYGSELKSSLSLGGVGANLLLKPWMKGVHKRKLK